MFRCENCLELFEDTEMSDVWNICINCKDDEEITELIALNII